MYSKIIFNILFLFLAVLFQIFFVNNLPYGLSKLNLILIILIFILSLANFEYAFWWALGVGFLLDVYSFHLFGTYLLAIIFSIIVANFLLINFFTNRSLYSFLMLSFLFLLIYELSLQFIFYFINIFSHQYIFRILKADFWLNLFQAEVYNLFLVIIVFYAINFITQKLKPVFLVKNKQ